MSDRMLYETYLPPFKAAVDAGVATLMNSFNDINGIPATGNKYLQRDLLKGLSALYIRQMMSGSSFGQKIQNALFIHFRVCIRRSSR